MRMKKLACFLLGGFLVMGMMAGCGNTSKADGNEKQKVASAAGQNDGNQDQGAEDNGAEDNSAEDNSADKDTDNGMDLSEISVISREEGSGTRGAFTELFGIMEKKEDGSKEDHTTEEAVISNSTEVVMTSVAGDINAIGYVSLGSLNDSVKAVSIDGTAAGVAAVKDGSYAVSRPFLIATNGGESDAAKDFINFMMSEEGQTIVEDNGYIAVDNNGAFQGSRPEGRIVAAGSSSVTPVMEKLAEAYQEINKKVEIEIQESDSTTGMNAVREGACDIGMASRELEKSETDAGLHSYAIAMDGIAVVVNKGNPISDLGKETVKNIFTGEYLAWNDVSRG